MHRHRHESLLMDDPIGGYKGLWREVPSQKKPTDWRKVRGWIYVVGLFLSGAAFGTFCANPADKLPLGLSVMTLLLTFWGIWEDQ